MLCLLSCVYLLKGSCAACMSWLLVISYYFILFPGGGCKICGSVEHFRRDCPELMQQNKGNKYLVAKMNIVVFLVIIDWIHLDVRSLVDSSALMQTDQNLFREEIQKHSTDCSCHYFKIYCSCTFSINVFSIQQGNCHYRC